MTASRILINNGKDVPLLLILEPWAEEYLVRAGAQVEVVGEGGSIEATFEVDLTPDGLVVHGWTGSTLRILEDGREMAPRDQPTA